MSISIVRCCTWCGCEFETKRKGALGLCKQACFAGFHRARMKIDPTLSATEFAQVLKDGIARGIHPNKKYKHKEATQ